jgi:glycosyltransferase involved in cell wall biosynthesis
MDLIWESFKQVHDRRQDVFLLVLGRKWPLLDRLGQAAQHVVQVGHLPMLQFAAALGCGDIMLLPYRDCSRNRGRWPGKVAFYMAVGRPTVSNPTGDVKMLMEQYGVGLLAGEEPKEFAGAILELLENERLAEQIGRRARATAEEVFSWSVLASSTERFYSSVLEERKGR